METEITRADGLMFRSRSPRLAGLNPTDHKWEVHDGPTGDRTDVPLLSGRHAMRTATGGPGAHPFAYDAVGHLDFEDDCRFVDDPKFRT